MDLQHFRGALAVPFYADALAVWGTPYVSSKCGGRSYYPLWNQRNQNSLFRGTWRAALIFANVRNVTFAVPVSIF
jgi:hypothetical protein